MNTVILTVLDGNGDHVEDLLIEDTGTGLDIRASKDPKCAADTSVNVDLAIGHCPECRSNTSVMSILGLDAAEAITLTRWRHRRSNGISAEEIGRIVDKVVKALNGPEILCDADSRRIRLRVESANG
jgi:hypothetical protein